MTKSFATTLIISVITPLMAAVIVILMGWISKEWQNLIIVLSILHLLFFIGAVLIIKNSFFVLLTMFTLWPTCILGIFGIVEAIHMYAHWCIPILEVMVLACRQSIR